MATTKRTHQRNKRRAQDRVTARVAARYEANAKEINAAKQAMQRVRREAEFEPERLHYVTSVSLQSVR
jgi:hypothetical protein